MLLEMQIEGIFRVLFSEELPRGATAGEGLAGTAPIGESSMPSHLTSLKANRAPPIRIRCRPAGALECHIVMITLRKEAREYWKLSNNQLGLRLLD